MMYSPSSSEVPLTVAGGPSPTIVAALTEHV